MKSALIFFVIIFSSSLVAHEVDKPPALWSWFKDMKVTKKQCITKSFLALSEVGITNASQNDYGFYGSINNNTIVVKCLSIDSANSKVMVAVAGSDYKSVEHLRNNIIGSIK